MHRTLPAVLLLAAVVAAADKPVAVKLGKLTVVAPADWKSEKPDNRLRSYQFKLPSAEPGLADAEVSVYPQSSPDPAKYFPRWKESYTPPDGKKLDDVAKESKFDVGPATVHVLDVSGTWKYRERPFDPKSKEEMRPEYRTVWLIVVVKDEATHVRLSGPEKVVAKHYPAFEKWIKSAK
jgi:hypothetical protein